MKETQPRDVGKEQGPYAAPYVISGDLPIVLSQWASKRSLRLPDAELINGLRSDFFGFMQSIFSSVIFVGEEELSEGMNSAIESQGLPVISMDPVYVRGMYQLSLSRMVDGDLNSIGLYRRENAPYVVSQLSTLQKEKISQACLVDDVIFEGNAGVRAIRALNRIGISVPVMVAGIAIQEGKGKIQQIGTDVIAIRTFPKVIDEICERDFWPGVNLSGRGVNGFDSVVGSPYVAPFGKPEWASIPPEKKIGFSRFCIDQSIRLFELLEEVNGRQISIEDLDRQVLYARTPGARFIDELKRNRI